MMKKARNSTLTHLSVLCACFIFFWQIKISIWCLFCLSRISLGRIWTYELRSLVRILLWFTFLFGIYLPNIFKVFFSSLWPILLGFLKKQAGTFKSCQDLNIQKNIWTKMLQRGIGSMQWKNFGPQIFLGLTILRID